jgi:hypothetical protein
LNSLDQQPDLFDFPDFSKEVDAFVRGLIASASRPSPGELVAKLDKDLGPKARWDLERIVGIIAGDQKVLRSDRDYLSSLLAEDGLAKSLRGENILEPTKVYPVHVTTRKSLGLMMRKLSVTESQRSAQFRGTFSRRKPSVASANWVQVA